MSVLIGKGTKNLSDIRANEIEAKYRLLDLGGMEITAMRLQRTERFVLGVIGYKRAVQCLITAEIHFLRLRSCRLLAVAHRDFGHVREWSASRETEHLREILTGNQDPWRLPEKYINFILHTDQSKFDIVAADFSFVITDKGLINN